MKKIFSFIIYYLLLINIAFSQSGWIMQSPLPTEYPLHTIKYIDNNTAIALAGPYSDSREGIILKTTNNGISWNKINTVIKNTLWDLFFINTNTGFAVGDSSIIIKTVDGGNNWSKLFSSDSTVYNYNTSVYFWDEFTGYVHNNSHRILKTTNGGINWIYLNIGYDVTSFANVFFVNATTGFIPHGTLCLKTTNGGEVWIPYTINNSLPSEKIYFLNELTGFAVGQSTIISKTTNGGINWVSNTLSYIATLQSIKFINNNIGYVAGDDITAKTTDKGNTWTKYFSPSLKIFSMDFFNEYTGLTVGLNDITKTTNGGDNWSLISSGTHRDIYAITFSDYASGYSFADNGEIIKTTNGGDNWIKLNPNGSVTYYYSPYFINSNTGIALANSGVYKTTNCGINWTQKISFASYPGGLFFLNPSLGYISYNGFYKTTDTGETWVQCSQLNRTVDYLFFTNAYTGYGAGYGAGYGHDIIKTTDGGYNWFSIDTIIVSHHITGISFPDSATGYISYTTYNSYIHILKTTNFGLNWTDKICSNIDEINSIFFINKNTGFITTYYYSYSSSLKKTTNGGDSWVDINVSPYNLNSIIFLDSNVGYAVGDYGIILKTTNGGSVWVSNNSQEIPSDYKLFQNFPNPFNPNTIIRFQIKDSRFVILKVYDILGKEITTLVNEKKPAGIYEINFNGSNLASGVYFYRIQIGDFVQVKKMVLIK